MAFTLATKEKSLDLTYIVDPMPEQIAKYENEGFSRIRDGSGSGSFFVNMKDEYMQERLKSALGVPHYKSFKETTGLKQWILYNPKQYRLEFNREDKYILRFDYYNYKGDPLEMPINASSMCSMFSWMKIPDNICFSKNWDTSNIVDMSALFAGTVFPEEFNIDIFKYSSLLNARYMFFDITIKRPDFLKNFIAPYIINAEYMFSKSTICDNFKVELYMPACTNMDCMFFQSSFKNRCDFGDKFIVPLESSHNNMFLNAIKDDKDLSRYSIESIVKYLKEDVLNAN